jgi:hypothetical protein
MKIEKKLQKNQKAKKKPEKKLENRRSIHKEILEKSTKSDYKVTGKSTAHVDP